MAKAARLGVLDLVQRVNVTTRVDESGAVTQGVDLRLYDAQGALQLIGKGFGLFVEREVVEERTMAPFTNEDFHEAAKEVQEWRKRTWPDLLVGGKDLTPSPSPARRGECQD
jgi:hypothetical protein